MFIRISDLKRKAYARATRGCAYLITFYILCITVFSLLINTCNLLCFHPRASNLPLSPQVKHSIRLLSGYSPLSTISLRREGNGRKGRVYVLSRHHIIETEYPYKWWHETTTIGTRGGRDTTRKLLYDTCL